MVNKRVHKLAKKILFKLSVRVEVSSVESNETTAATVIRYDTRCYFNVRSKADISQLNLPHGTDN